MSGFVDVAQLKLFLLSQHAIRKKVKEIRAVYESDDNVEAKVKKLAGTAVPEPRHLAHDLVVGRIHVVGKLHLGHRPQAVDAHA